jgi:multidrug efflux pump subunit AcrA (membrane-fusion protein)
MTTATRPTPPVAPPEPSPYAEAAPRRKSKKALVVMGALVALLVAVGLAWTLLRGEDESPIEEAPAATPTAATGLAAKDLDGDGVVYQSGMHPWIVEDAPGQCPICGMDLQPVPVSGASEGTVEIDAATVQNIGVRTAPVEVRALSRDLRATGTFEANERAREAVSLKVGGWVEELYVDAEGDRVRRGQPLLALYSPQLVSTQEEYLLALRHRALLGGPDGSGDGDRLVEAARRRLALFDISAEQIARLEATGEVTRTLTIYAPATGTVTQKRVVEGQQAMAGMTLMEIVDLSGLWLQVAVPEQDLGWVGVGTRAVVRLESQPGQELTGRVEYVYDTLDPATRTGTARVSVPNPGGRLKPGMYATATLFGAPSEARPTVPAEAVIRTGEEAVVILALGEGRFRPQPVTLGEEGEGAIQILEGLDGTERVVTSAQFLLDSEARLAAAVGAMAGAPATDAPDPLGEVDHSQMNH